MDFPEFREISFCYPDNSGLVYRYAGAIEAIDIVVGFLDQSAVALLQGSDCLGIAFWKAKVQVIAGKMGTGVYQKLCDRLFRAAANQSNYTMAVTGTWARKGV